MLFTCFRTQKILNSLTLTLPWGIPQTPRLKKHQEGTSSPEIMGIQNLGCGERSQRGHEIPLWLLQLSLPSLPVGQIKAGKVITSTFSFSYGLGSCKMYSSSNLRNITAMGNVTEQKKKKKTSKTILLHSPQPSPTESFYLCNAFQFNE